MALVPALALGSVNEHNDSDFAWLIGCWVSPDKSAQEVWVTNRDGSLAGFAVNIRDNRIGFYEVLSIKQKDAGVWTYTAHPSGQESAVFTVDENLTKN